MLPWMFNLKCYGIGGICKELHVSQICSLSDTEDMSIPARSIILPIDTNKNMKSLFYHATFTLWQHLVLSHHLDAEWHDCIVISFHIIFYASVTFHLHFSMSN